MLHILTDTLRNSILITGLVVVMMMMIESLNIESKGMFFKGLRRTKTGQIIIGALLGSIPGCMGGFATVSLYTHRMLSFGALVAMMIASSGDESFIMLAMIPHKALILFAVLFIVAVIAGFIVDRMYDRKHSQYCHKHDHEECGIETDCEGFELHEHGCKSGSAEISHESKEGTEKSRHYGWKRICMFACLAIFIAALSTGQLGHDHSAHVDHNHSVQDNHEHSAHCVHMEHSTHETSSETHNHSHDGFTLLSEDWMNVLFAGLSVIILLVLIFASDHFVEEHLWKHVIRKHLPTIFAWTFGVLLLLGIALKHVDIMHWTSTNTSLMIILATLVGIIPESGPHLIFLTLYASGAVSFPVLLASSISQDGHASIPLLAESKKSFLWAKLINCVVALAVGFAAMLLM